MFKKLLNSKMIGMLAILLALFVVAGAAEEVKKSGNWRYVLEDGGAKITGPLKELRGNLKIPGKLGKHAVTSIGKNALLWCFDVTQVTLPASVTSIQGNPFRECNIASFTVARKNPVFESVDGVLFDKQRKGLVAYPRQKKDDAYAVPDGVTFIGESAFGYCDGLTRVDIPDSVTIIGDHAFVGCYSLTRVDIPDSVTSIGYNAFAGCMNLTSVILPECVTNIGESAFSWCYGLTSVIIPEGVTSIGKETFFCCVGLTRVIIPDSVTSIENRAFRSCSRLTSLSIPDSVTSIEKDAFDKCDNLTLIVAADSYAEQYAKENEIPYVFTTE